MRISSQEKTRSDRIEIQSRKSKCLYQQRKSEKEEPEGRSRKKGRNETAARRRERTSTAGKIRRERKTRETSCAKPEDTAKPKSKKGENQPEFRSFKYEKVWGECWQDVP